MRAAPTYQFEESIVPKVLFSVLFSSLSLVAQTSAVVGAGYVPPAPVSVAPGQILTVYAAGLDVPSAAHAPAGALPTSLGGVTATLRQGSELAVPILDVRSVSTCPNLAHIPEQTSCANLLAATVQIPYELVPLCPLCARPTLLPAELFLSVNDHDSAPIELNALADQVHVLSACDLILLPPGGAPPPNTTGLGCAPIVTHRDGSLVSASSPAEVGEALIAWVVGLGHTDSATTTGQPAPAADSTLQTYSLDFNYTVNALPVKPYTGRPDVKPPHPLFAGLAPGYVGLYQVNFVVPPEPTGGTPRCPEQGTFGPGADVPQSNLTVSIGGGFSFDGAAICVATRIPVD